VEKTKYIVVFPLQEWLTVDARMLPECVYYLSCLYVLTVTAWIWPILCFVWKLSVSRFTIFTL